MTDKPTTILQAFYDGKGPFGLANSFVASSIENCFWFLLGAILLSWLLPRMADFYEYNKAIFARRIMAGRMASVHYHLFRYAAHLEQRLRAGHAPDPNSEYKTDLVNALTHLMDAPRHFAVTLKGDVTHRYFHYRVLVTNTAAFIAKSAGDFDGGFTQIFFTKIKVNAPNIAKVNESYRQLLKALGKNIWKIDAQQPYVAPWNEAELEAYKTLITYFSALKRSPAAPTIEIPSEPPPQSSPQPLAASVDTTYSFAGVEANYAQFRPEWPETFAVQSLKAAGIRRHPDGHWEGIGARQRPVVASIGAGAGADAAAFKALGCTVILVDPNRELLKQARARMLAIAPGEARFRVGHAAQTGIIPGSVDLIVVAQALHTMKQAHAARFDQGTKSGTSLEERARRHWRTLLIDKTRAALAIWYYNPDPDAQASIELDYLLRRISPTYAGSGTPFLNAPYMRPHQTDPWIERSQLQVSGPIRLEAIKLKPDQVKGWLSSYSFAPADPEALERQAVILQDVWFSTFAKKNRLSVGFVGFIMQGPLRKRANDTRKPEPDTATLSPLDRL